MNPSGILVNMIPIRSNLCFKEISCCLSYFCVSNNFMIVCSEKILENAQIKFPNFECFNSNA